MLPKVQYHDEVLNTQNFMTTTEVAKSEGMTAQTLNKILEESKVLWRVGYRGKASLKLKSSYPLNFTSNYDYLVTDGFAKVATYIYENSKGTTSKHAIKWSEKGRKWLHEFLEELIGTQVEERNAK